MYLKRIALLAASAFLALPALAQYQDAAPQSEAGKVVLTLEDALKIALSENTSVKVAEKSTSAPTRRTMMEKAPRAVAAWPA